MVAWRIPRSFPPREMVSIKALLHNKKKSAHTVSTPSYTDDSPQKTSTLLRHEPVAEPRQVNHLIITQLATANNSDPMFFVEVVAWLNRLIPFTQGAGQLRVALEAHP